MVVVLCRLEIETEIEIHPRIVFLSELCNVWKEKAWVLGRNKVILHQTPASASRWDTTNKNVGVCSASLIQE